MDRRFALMHARRMDDALMSSDKMDWQTPHDVLDLVRRVGDIYLDPCTAPSNPTGATHFCSIDTGTNGLAYDWAAILDWARAQGARNPLAYVNPPYGPALKEWAAKVNREAAAGAQIITLTPARTDTGWWHTLADLANSGLFWRGRMRFIDAATGIQSKNAAPFPVFLAYFGPAPSLFRTVFAGRGRLYNP
jgi:site-specific DNA-methyltransferase (adenine-specific)